MIRRWLTEAYVRLPGSLDPLLDAGRRYVMPVLRRTLPATRLVGRTASGETVRVLVVDRRLTAGRLCHSLFVHEPEAEWSSRVPLTGLRKFVERERGTVDLVLANVPRGLPAFLRLARGILLPGLVELVLPVMADREAQYRLAHSKRRNRLRRCDKAGYSWRVGRQADEIRHFLAEYHRPHVTGKFGEDVILQESYILERHARRGGVIWLLHEGRVVGGDLFRRDGDRLWLMVTGLAPEPPKTVPTPQEALFLLSTDLARENGCRTVSFGAAAPILREGLMQFKLSLGAKICDYQESHRQLVVDWAHPTPSLHRLLQSNPLIIQRDRGFAALTSTVGVDPTAHLAETRRFVPAEIGPVFALHPGADTIEAAMASIAAPDDGTLLPLGQAG